MNSILIDHISHHYGDVEALNDIHLEVEKGELFGLIGPDGAGKTTIFRILTTLLIPEKGRATVEDYDVVSDYREIRKIVGYMPGRFSLYQDLTVRENLNFFATIFQSTIKENFDLIEDIYVQLEPFESRRAGALSGGMKQKLALCCALIHRPKVLFLDEPTTGVDAVSRKEFWGMLKRLKEKGITIFVSTPYMDEASRCDRIALIQEGQIFTIATPDSLIKQFPHTLYGVKTPDMYQLLLDLERFNGTDRTYAFGEYHHLILKDGNKEDVYDFLNGMGHFDIVIEEVLPTVEDCFLEYMNDLAQ
ncbi:MAG: ABC transporter ATP-binding protein [Saprospiraceae bacterium]|nr:ABC transporter ATP-binding protein [Saprospiraceae bacterium]